MCGIFGLIFHGEKHLERPMDAGLLFTMLAAEASSRGTDATGMAIVHMDRVEHMYRNTNPSWQVINYKKWWQNLRGLETPAIAVIGHTRWGTHGANTIENAHPFMFVNPIHGNFVGTHNGQIQNHRSFGPEKAYDNDSRNLFHGLAHVPKEKWPAMLNQVRGNYALAFGTPGRFHLARNYGSPCVLAYCSELDATVYASTAEILQQSAKKAKMILGKIRTLPVGELRTYTPGKSFKDFEKVDFQPYEQTSIMKFFNTCESSSGYRNSGVRRKDGFFVCDGCDELVPGITYAYPYGYVCSECEYGLRNMQEDAAKQTQEYLETRSAEDETLFESCGLCYNNFVASDNGKLFSFSQRWQMMVCYDCQEMEVTGRLPGILPVSEGCTP